MKLRSVKLLVFLFFCGCASHEPFRYLIALIQPAMAVSSAAASFWIEKQEWPQSVEDVRHALDVWREDPSSWERTRDNLAEVRFFRRSNRSLVISGFLLHPERRAFIATIVMKEAPKVASGWASWTDIELEEKPPNKAPEPTR